jgi:hypothetical protein
MNSIFTEDAFYMCCFFVGRSEKEGSIEGNQRLGVLALSAVPKSSLQLYIAGS